MGQVYSPQRMVKIADKEQISVWLEEALRSHPDLFLIDLAINGDQVKIVLDGDQGVALKDCVAINRSLERTLEEHDINVSLEVSSAGLNTPLSMARQYKKNIGRKLAVVTDSEKFEGTLTGVSDEIITLEWKAREAKPVGKGKRTVEKKVEIPMQQIREAKVKITF